VRRLTLVRHGQAEWQAAALADFDRPLTRRGRAEAASTARRLRAREDEPPPGLLLTSPAVRARQTAEILAQELDLPARAVKTVDALYLAPPAEIRAAIAATGGRVGHLLIVGHNPGLSELARELAPEARLDGLATGACCRLTFDAPDWRSLGIASEAACEAPGRLFDLWH
jgi:phosphohistidine phosphatase